MNWMTNMRYQQNMRKYCYQRSEMPAAATDQFHSAAAGIQNTN